ncbi:hypothetical protein LKL35_35955 [Streptomyces sp. ET3-23]|uniref:hypothetical protein n=1 Tax=Streptomyces sp. ET3-23 TaxID=2885643 RepID=UPI001D12665E|nr:hypothetical protein [Streptomyces sp. ET3-23]MCC2280735.1 hypothetical protein [Streptomyces sp. ET3-23]
MPSAPGQEDLAVFLAELHGFFEACDETVDAALARHFGEDTAVDWIVATIELFAEGLTGHPFLPASTSELPGVTT